jgi:hypothetical protein
MISKTALLEVIFLSSISSSALRLFPNSNAAAIEIALASPIPLNSNDKMIE